MLVVVYVRTIANSVTALRPCVVALHATLLHTSPMRRRVVLSNISYFIYCHVRYLERLKKPKLTTVNFVN